MHYLEGFSVVIDHGDSTSRVTIHGDLDLATGPRLLAGTERALSDGLRPTVVVDLAGITFVDARGLRALIGLRDRLTDSGRTVQMANPSRQVRRLVGLLEIDL